MRSTVPQERSEATKRPPLVLVVDDDPEIRDSVRWLLQDEGLMVETAADGQQALDRAAELRPDLIVLDLGLPILSGEEVAAELRARPADCPPIVVMTAAGRAAQKAQQIGAAGFIPKPFDLDELARTVWGALGRDR